MTLLRFSNGLLSQSRLVGRIVRNDQSSVYTQQCLFHTSTRLARELTEGTSSTEPHTSGFQRLRQSVTNFIVGGKSSGNDPKGHGDVDRQQSPEAHPFPDERAGSIYVQAQWQDGGVIHDVKPHGQGISLSSSQRAEEQAEKDVASA